MVRPAHTAPAGAKLNGRARSPQRACAPPRRHVLPKNFMTPCCKNIGWIPRRRGGAQARFGLRALPLCSAPAGRYERGGRCPPVPRGYALHRRLFTCRTSGAESCVQRLFTSHSFGVLMPQFPIVFTARQNSLYIVKCQVVAVEIKLNPFILQSSRRRPWRTIPARRLPGCRAMNTRRGLF